MRSDSSQGSAGLSRTASTRIRRITRISHQPSITTADMAPPAFRQLADSVGRPRRIPEDTPSDGLGRKPCGQCHLSHFTTKTGEKSGLALVLGILVSCVMLRAASAETFVVTTSSASGEGSLRQAIIDANAIAGLDSVVFNIPGSGPHVIMQSSSLPSLSDPTVIDGYTQPDAAPATEGSPADIKIELNGGSSVSTGLSITAAGCTIRGLAVARFAYGITLTGPGGTRIEGNHVGTDASGSFAGGNTVGIRILSQGHTIGGTDPGARNIISGNGDDGIRISTGQWSTEPGIGNTIQGNYIGTGATGITDIGNGGCGIAIQWGADNLIGSGGRGAGNTIAYNQDVGVFVAHGIRNAILSNAIFSNGALGIDLLWDYWDSDPDGVNPNDTGDGDWGANELQNFPVLTSIAVTNDSTIIGGTLHSLPLTDFLIEFYSNSATDFSNYGEGQAFLGSSVVTTDELGNGEFTAVFPLVLAPGLFISSTATDPLHNTSEFSLCLVYMGSLLVTNTNDTGPGSLRNAFTNANLTAGADTVAFDIPGPGPFTIRPTTALPELNESVVIDGYTQPGASPASSLDPPVLQIELDGSAAGIGASGIMLFGGSSTVRGLAINGFDAYGIILDQSDNNVIEGSFVGTDISGTADRGNGGGIYVGSMGNTIGGLAPHTRNVIAGNRGDGVTVRGRDNLIQGNFVGTDLSGTCALGNGNGIVLSSGNVVGGEEPESSNLVSGNLGDGILVLGSENLIEGNRIGSGSTEGLARISHQPSTTTADMASPASLRSVGRPRRIAEDTPSDGLGRKPCGQCHLSHFTTKAGEKSGLGNGGAGIRIGESSEPLHSFSGEEKGIRGSGHAETSAGPPMAESNALLSNSISMNGGLGIDISPSGVNENDTGDYDDGPNGGQNFPVLTQVLTSGDSTLIQGILNSTPGSAFRIDFFLSNAPDGTGYGEGETFLCTTNVAANGVGNAVIEAIVPSILPTGSFISCTATDSENNTSEFSQCLAIQGDMVVTNTKNSGPGSLRLAILTANTTDEPDTISFDIPGAGPHIIQPTSPLPDIVAPVVLDGYTQSGSTPATETAPAALQIRLHGVLTSQGSCGLSIAAGNSTVRGFIISAFPDCGILIHEHGNNVIEGNWVGVSCDAGAQGNGACGILVLDSCGNTIGGMSIAARNIISGNQADGIRFDGADAYDNVVLGNFIGTNITGMETCGNSGCGVAIGGPDNTIGGSLVAARNVISGNASNGVALDESGADGNTIQGNFIGTDASGKQALGNGGCGIFIRTSDNLIGGPAEGARNIISANNMDGICLAYMSARRNEVQGNLIGTDVSGELPLGNMGSGVQVRGASDNTIGGEQVNQGNLIAYNTGHGIAVTSGARNALLSNTISENGGLGIDLGNTGVTANDPGDGDGGANNLQNFPELSTALADSFWSITLEGLLNSTANTLFTLQFFVSTTNDPSGYGEGGLFLGAQTITTDSQGNASFSTTFAGGPLPAGSYASVTATDPGNNTSEFGRSVPVQGVGSVEQPEVLIHGASENFPNPFSGRTQIKLSLADHSPVTLKVYNMAGELIRTLISSDMEPGVHTLMWDCRDAAGRLAPPGVYVYRVQAQRINRSGRMILIEGVRN